MPIIMWFLSTNNLVLIVVFSVFPAYAFDFERAPLEIHLPQSSVYSIIQDRNGFLWFATREGVARWDGYNMRVLRNKPFDEHSIPGNVVHKLIEDCHGNIWAWTQGDPFNRTSVARIDAPENSQVKRYNYNDAMLFKGKDCALWLVDKQAIYRYDYDQENFIKKIKNKPGTRITTGIQTDKNTLWFGDDKGIISKCEIHSNQCKAINQSSNWPFGHGIITLFENSNKSLLVTSWKQGIRGIDPISGMIKKKDGLSDYINTNNVREIIRSNKDTLLMITSMGVVEVSKDLGDYNTSPIFHENGKNNPDSTTLFTDDTGALWVGNMWGVYLSDPYRKKFKHMGHNPIDDNSLSAGLVMAIHPNEDQLWVGSFGGGLNSVSSNSGDVRRFPTQKQSPGYGTYSQIVWAIDHDSLGNVWVASESLNRLDLETGKIDIFKADPENFVIKTNIEHVAFTDTINDIYVDKQDIIWLATATGLFSFDNKTETFSDNYLASIGFIYNVTDAGDGNLWIGSSHAGLIKYNPEKGIIKRYQYQAGKKGTLSNNTVLFVYEDKLSNLWVGTYSGLNRLNKGADTFELYTVDNGLPGDAVIYMLEVDSSENSQTNTTELWISSNRGLAKLSIKDAKIEGIRIFDASYGIHNTEFNRSAATQVGDKFYFGGDRGITYFSPKQIVDNPNPPALAITSAYQINEIDKQHQEINIHKPIVIGAGTLVFGFEFTALSFSYPHHNQYSYQLQGFESNWSSASQQRQAHYPNVPPGEYLFRVRGSNADGQWNQKTIAIPVIVLPWFWETLWFQLIMLLLVILLIVIAVVYIMRNRYNKHLQKIKYQQALLNERNRISQDMHDEIGASLSEIVIYSQQQAMNGSSKPFENIAIKARGVLESIGEIIWATNPRNDKFNTLLAYMREQAVTMIEGVSIKAVLSFPENTDNRKLTAEFRRNVYLIMKEAIINAIKHAHADKIIVSVKINNNQMKLLIQDDGNGHIKQRKNGMGLKNMQKRAEALHADLSIQSLESEGCKIELVCVLP